MKLLAYTALFAGANAIQRFRIGEIQIANAGLENRVARDERRNAPAPRSFDSAVNSGFEENGDNTEVVLMRIPPMSNFMQTMPDAQYDDDIEATGSHGMEAKHEGTYVNGMMGNEKLQPKKAMVGGSMIDLVQGKETPKETPKEANTDPEALENKKIGVNGGTGTVDMAGPGMSGTETIHGPAIVTGTAVVFKQGAAKPIATNQQKLVQTLSQQDHTIDGVAYNTNQAEMDAMIEDHYKPEEEAKQIFAQSDNEEVRRMQASALSDIEYSKYNEGSEARLNAYTEQLI